MRKVMRFTTLQISGNIFHTNKFNLIIIYHSVLIFKEGTWYLMSSEPHHSPCLWRWRQPQACEQCPQWSCPPGSSPCPLCPSTYLKKGNLFFWQWKFYFFTCYNDNRTGTGNIHAIGFKNKLKTIPYGFIFESHPYLLFFQCFYHQTRPAFNNVKPKDWYFVFD